MKGEFIPGLGFIDYAGTDFTCPYCEKRHSDEYGKLIDRCNNNKSFITKIKCECGERIGVTYDFMGDMVGFKLPTKSERSKWNYLNKKAELMYKQSDTVITITRKN